MVAPPFTAELTPTLSQSEFDAKKAELLKKLT